MVKELELDNLIDVGAIVAGVGLSPLTVDRVIRAAVRRDRQGCPC